MTTKLLVSAISWIPSIPHQPYFNIVQVHVYHMYMSYWVYTLSGAGYERFCTIWKVYKEENVLYWYEVN